MEELPELARFAQHERRYGEDHVPAGHGRIVEEAVPGLFPSLRSLQGAQEGEDVEGVFRLEDGQVFREERRTLAGQQQDLFELVAQGDGGQRQGFGQGFLHAGPEG